ALLTGGPGRAIAVAAGQRCRPQSVPSAFNEAPLKTLASEIDVTADAIGFAAAELACVFVAIWQRPRTAPLHNAVLPFAHVGEIGLVAIAAVPVRAAVLHESAKFGVERSRVIGGPTLDAPDQAPRASDFAFDIVAQRVRNPHEIEIVGRRG